MPESVEGVAKQIRAARRALGLSQGELAERVGVTQGTVSNVERGACGSPQVVTWIEIELGLPVGAFNTAREVEAETNRAARRERAIELRLAGKTIHAIAARLGCSPNLIAEFLDSDRRTQDRPHGPRSRYRAVEPRPCGCGCGELVAVKPWQAADRDTSFVDDEHRLVAMEHDRQEVKQRAAAQYLLDSGAVADRLGVGEHRVADYRREGILDGVLLEGRWHHEHFYSADAVKACEDEIVQRARRDPRASTRILNPEVKVAHMRSRGFGRDVKAGRLSEREAETLFRAQAQKRRKQYVNRIKRGRRVDLGRHQRLLACAEECLAEALSDGWMPRMSDVLGEVALRDWQANREDWKREYVASPQDADSFAPGFREPAIARVRRLIGEDVKKLLQNAQTKMA